MDSSSLFFTYRSQIPEGVGFSHFGQTHITYLVVITAFIILVSLLYKRQSEKVKKIIRLTIASIIVLMEVAKNIILIYQGNYSFEILPLHLCGISIFIIAIHSIKPNKFTSEMMYSLSIPGAVMALLFADWTMYPIWNVFCLQSFLIHMLELTFPIMLLTAREIRPNIKNLWMPALFMLIFAPIIYHLNHLMDTNFLFINEAAPNSPLSFLQTILGSPGYVFGTIGILLIVWIILYLPVVVLDKRKRKK